ncbi:hypothetical protein [Rufibacter quisquiliarum]|uniref:Lipoprotein n=1 Tax=Rufibacter quisquiliarum TaxID=1549639 RepID=A0A839GL12_9BACT|nr:hypothetical protein [Rufibacter quisquiliarum]MBA9078493.1 hypothetical protein [Rufibacter quisquiliarum]
MKRKISSLLCVLGMVFSVISCQIPASPQEGEGSDASSQWLAYPETQCADPWGYCNKSGDKTVCVREHLEKLGVDVLAVTVSGSLGDGAVCLACQCASGRIFKVKVNQADVDRVVAIGFKKF